MDGIHPKFVLSKRFPVHAAIEQLNLHALKDLLTPVSDARFHFGRKLTATDLSVLHQACANRPQGLQAVVDIVKLLTALGAPVNDVDVVDQTPLFYAVSHCQASQLVPILLRAGTQQLFLTYPFKDIHTNLLQGGGRGLNNVREGGDYCCMI